MQGTKMRENRLQTIAHICLAITAGVGLLGLTGWASDSRMLMSFIPEYKPISPVSALCFLVLGSSFLLYLHRPGSRIARIAAIAGAFLTAGICSAVLVAFVGDMPREFERLGFRTSAALPAGHMCSLGAICIITATAGILCLSLSQRRITHYLDIAGFLSLISLFTGLIAFISYLYGTPLFHNACSIPLSMPAAFALFSLGFGLLAAAGPDTPLMRLFAGSSVQSRLNRTFIPIIVLLVLVNDTLQKLLASLAITNHALADLLIALVSASLAGVIVARFAKSLSQKIERVQEELREKDVILDENNKRFALAAKGANVGLWDWDIVNNDFFVSPLCYELLGYASALPSVETGAWIPLELPGLAETGDKQGKHHTGSAPPDHPSLRILAHPEDADLLQDLLYRHLTERSPFKAEYRIRIPDGSHRWLSTSGQALWDEEGRPVRMAGSSTDITERKLAEDKLAHSERILRLIVENVQEVFWVSEVKSKKMIYVSPNYEQLWKESWEEYDDRMTAYVSRVHPEDQERVRSAILGDIMKPAGTEHRIMRKDGSCRWVEGRRFPVRDESGQADYYVGVVKDITEQVAMREGLRKGKEEWEATFDAINDAITIHDGDYNILRANKAAVALLGTSFSEMRARKCFELYHGCGTPPAHCPSCESLQQGVISNHVVFEPHLEKHLEIKALPLLEEGKPIRLVHVVRDVSEQLKTEEKQQALQHQFLHIQKMDSIGRLAGGVAHDFNNILSGILGFSDLILLGAAPSPKIRDQVKLIKTLGEKAALLTKQLLIFSRKQLMVMEEISLNDVTSHMMKMLERIIGEDVAIEMFLDESVKTIWADRGQMEQVLMNLAVNARDAMPLGGKLTVSASNIRLNHEDAQLLDGIKGGDYVLLSLRDTGCGMSAEVLDKIFEPFFTTKDVGKGTGLGLATVYGIIKKHNGALEVKSKSGGGTEFRIYLPALTGKALTEISGNTEVPLEGGQETILVVDDEPVILSILVGSLIPLGYRLLTAATPSEALKISRTHENKIDLLLTDLIMPEMNGRELAAMIKAGCPRIKTLFMSGYGPSQGNAGMGSNDHYIEKPLRIEALTRKIRFLLEEGGASAGGGKKHH